MKREQIIEAARKLFNKYGFKKVSMDEIARSAGVTKKTVYTYFSSKEELFNYFVQEELNNMKKVVEEIEKQNLNFYESIHQIIYKLLQYKNKRQFIKVIVEEASVLKNPIIVQSIKKIDTQIQNYILQKIKFAIDNNYIETEDPEIIAFLIYKMYLALMFDWTGTNKKLDENIIADNILKIFKNGIGKRENYK